MTWAASCPCDTASTKYLAICSDFIIPLALMPLTMAASQVQMAMLANIGSPTIASFSTSSSVKTSLWTSTAKLGLFRRDMKTSIKDAREYLSMAESTSASLVTKVDVIMASCPAALHIFSTPCVRRRCHLLKFSVVKKVKRKVTMCVMVWQKPTKKEVCLWRSSKSGFVSPVWLLRSMGCMHKIVRKKLHKVMASSTQSTPLVRIVPVLTKSTRSVTSNDEW
mmetsp:Transcript_67921/g.180750  ORF Transcript_67921/g.180750 Transcript_67921/m.180750 type:complete len:222 (-) Transcript_67921:227-892(-)